MLPVVGAKNTGYRVGPPHVLFIGRFSKPPSGIQPVAPLPRKKGSSPEIVPVPASDGRGRCPRTPRIFRFGAASMDARMGDAPPGVARCPMAAPRRSGRLPQLPYPPGRHRPGYGSCWWPQGAKSWGLGRSPRDAWGVPLDSVQFRAKSRKKYPGAVDAPPRLCPRAQCLFAPTRRGWRSPLRTHSVTVHSVASGRPWSYGRR